MSPSGGSKADLVSWHGNARVECNSDVGLSTVFEYRYETV